MTLTILLAVLSQSPETELPKNVALADLGLHVINVGYQRTVHPHVALQASIGLYTPWTQNINLLGLSGEANRGDCTGYVLRVRPFFYLIKEAPRGLWVSPFVQGALAYQTAGSETVWGQVWAGGASVGWAWLPFDRLHIVFGLGGQFHASVFSKGPQFARFYPTLDGSLGWAF